MRQIKINQARKFERKGMWFSAAAMWAKGNRKKEILDCASQKIYSSDKIYDKTNENLNLLFKLQKDVDKANNVDKLYSLTLNFFKLIKT